MLSVEEQIKLTEACRALPLSQNTLAVENNYVLLLVALVLDFQLKQPAIDKAIEFFKKHHNFDGHRQFRELVDGFENTEEGNRELAQTLWNNKHWTRAEYLRVLLNEFEVRGLDSTAALATWVTTARFERDVEGQFTTKYASTGRIRHSLSYAMFQYIRLKLGHETVKPHRRVLDFLEAVLRRRPKGPDAGLEAAAKTFGRSVRELDAAIYAPAK